MNKKELDNWFAELDFQELESITGFRQYNFDPEDGYQDFVDACDNWWKELSTGEKKEIYNEYNE